MKPKKNASYGAVISIILILAIIVVGAFFVWGKRVSQQGRTVTLPTQTVNEASSTTATTTP